MKKIRARVRLCVKKCRHRFCTAVIVAAGSGQRMGMDKIFAPLGDEPVLAKTLRCFEQNDETDEIIVVVRRDHLEDTAELCKSSGFTKVSQVVPGGATRAESALSGAQSASKKAEIILIHDGARPFVTQRLISEAVSMATRSRAAIPALPVKDTIKMCSGGKVTETPERSMLYAVQTPQAFEADIIKAALTQAVKSGKSYTDDSAAVEALGIPVFIFEGDERNQKLTTPEDYNAALKSLDTEERK